MTMTMRAGTAAALLTGGVVGVSVLLASCGGRNPDFAGFVDDRAGLLSAADEENIARWHAALLDQYDIDYRVLTVTGTDDLSRLAVRHFEQARVGSRSGTGRGLLLVIDAKHDRVRLEVARALEGVFVDSFVAFVEREQMAPFFAAERPGDGIVATSELIAGRAEEALAASALEARNVVASSTGAGAESTAEMGSGYDRPTSRALTDTDAQSSPVDTVAAYLAAMAAHDASPDLGLYTPATRAMVAGHVMTRAQMDNLVRSYSACPETRAREHGDHAVVDHPGDPGVCAPWFVERGRDGLWRLDLLTMQRAVRFDTRNRWRVAAPQALGPYAFAFED